MVAILFGVTLCEMLTLRLFHGHLRTPPKVAPATSTGESGVTEVSEPKQFLGCISAISRQQVLDGCIKHMVFKIREAKH